MKKVLLVLTVLFSLLTSVNAQTIKDVTMGKPYSGSEAERTTLGGIDMVQYVYSLNDDRVYEVIYSPINSKDKQVRVTSTDVDRLVTGLNRKYNVNLKRVSGKTATQYIAQLPGNNVIGLFVVDHNEYMTPAYMIRVSMWNTELSKINEKEEQDRISSDF